MFTNIIKSVLLFTLSMILVVSSSAQENRIERAKRYILVQEKENKDSKTEKVTKKEKTIKTKKSAKTEKPTNSEEEIKSEKPENKEKATSEIVKSPFSTGYFLEGQTQFIPTKKTLELIMKHKFGNLEKGISDIWGVYGASNILTGLNYSITNNFLVGFSTIKFKKTQELEWKYSILKQTKSNSIPVFVTYYGNMAVNASGNTEFTKFARRISYFHQLIISRKINRNIAVQVAPGYIHYNLADRAKSQIHDYYTMSLNSKIKFSPQSSFLVAYDFLYNNPNKDIYKPGLSFGVEIITATHAFQITMGNLQGITSQYNYSDNNNEIKFKDFLLGFNITRLWSF